MPREYLLYLLRTDKNLCRCLGAPVFPHLLITLLCEPPRFSTLEGVGSIDRNDNDTRWSHKMLDPRDVAQAWRNRVQLAQAQREVQSAGPAQAGQQRSAPPHTTCATRSTPPRPATAPLHQCTSASYTRQACRSSLSSACWAGLACARSPRTPVRHFRTTQRRRQRPRGGQPRCL